jgi:transcriptional regulator with XRE-family HTH domain
MMDTASESFGRRLKSQRERRGIALETIAASTKIKASLLKDLERDDVSKWPRGIFRRAFVREYAASIGLPPESIVAEFVRLFPNEDALPGGAIAPEQAQHLRLTFANAGRPPLKDTALQVLIATLEVCAILAVARILTWPTGLSFWTVSAAAALTYYPLTSACCGRSLALWWLHCSRQSRVARADQRVRTNARDLLELIVQQAQIGRPDGHAGTIATHATAENLQAASRAILPS